MFYSIIFIKKHYNVRKNRKINSESYRCFNVWWDDTTIYLPDVEKKLAKRLSNDVDNKLKHHGVNKKL